MLSRTIRVGSIAVEMTDRPQGGYALVVRDDGVGLPHELDLDRIGSMGLQLVRDLTEQLGGTLRVTSIVGTEFAIMIPSEEGRA